MPKRPVVEEVVEELAENEEFISRDDINIEVYSTEESEGGEHAVYVKFTGFEDEEDADDYAQFLAETLPLLLFETTKLQ